jgi:hypothetical protein
MSAQPQQAAAAAGAERVVAIRKTPGGPGQQYEIKWRGQAETTWEAASRVRRQIPALVQDFEQAQQQQQQQSADDAAAEEEEGAEGAVMRDDQPAEEAFAADGSSMRAQMEAMQRLLREQAQQLQLLRASPAHSPQPSPHLSPQQAQRNIAGAAAAAAAPVAGAVAQEQQSRFARKEPRAQDLREYDGAAGAKLDEWLQELALAAYLYELNAREALKFAVSRLRGAALQWWLALNADARAAMGDADALGRALRARFQPVTTARVAREQLLALQQGGRHVNDYIADFQRLHTLLPSMAEEDALHLFERGLRRERAEKLRVQGVSSLQDAIAMAARVGGLLHAPTAPHSRTAAVNQMEVDDGDGASLGERITQLQATLNALQAQRAQGGPARASAPRRRRSAATRAIGADAVAREAGAEGDSEARTARRVCPKCLACRLPLSSNAARQASATAVGAASTRVSSARMPPPPRSRQTKGPGAGAAPAAHGVAGARARPPRIQRASDT